MRAAVLILMMISTCATLLSQNLTRRLPSRRATARVSASTEPRHRDTVHGEICDSIVLSGFDKPLRAVRESMFATNRSSMPVEALGIEIIYSDMSGRMLHKATHEVSCELPAGETRRIEVRSFDRSGLFHYRLSPAPKRAAQATPFDVSAKVIYLIPANISNH